MLSIALAVLFGLAAFPLVLVFGPVYFPWSLLVLAGFGGVVGLSIVPRAQGSGVLRGFTLALLMAAVVLGVFTLTANVVFAPAVLVSQLVWIGWFLLPMLVGVSAGAWLRARLGLVGGIGSGAALVFAVFLVGAGLAFALAPPEIAHAPACDGGFDCPRTQCADMAERRRLFAIERVTAYDGQRITCTYTAWGGIYIGRAEMGRGGGSWTDGAWPEILSGRGR